MDAPTIQHEETNPTIPAKYAFATLYSVLNPTIK